jgi:hypothetical protein
VEQGAVRVDGRRITDPTESVEIAGSVVLEVGKRRIVRVRIESEQI